MAKGRIKELLFDINNNSLMELDESGNPIDHSDKTGDELLDVLLDVDRVVTEEKEAKTEEIANEESTENENTQQRDEKQDDALEKEVLKESEAADTDEYELLSEETRETIIQGKEKFEEMVALGTEKVNKTIHTTKKMTKKASKKAAKKAKKASQKAAELAKNAAEKAKPIADNASENIRNSASAIKEETKKKIDKAQDDIKKNGWKQFLMDNRITVLLALAVIVLGGGLYYRNYRSLPTLGKTHLETSGTSYKKLDVEHHPMELLSTVRENMQELKGDPISKGDGKKAETKYDIYKMNWFGKQRNTIFFYNNKQEYNRIKLQIGDQTGQQLYDTLKEQLGTPFDDKDPSKREGYAIWIKDSIRYKLMHRGKYASIEMSLANYDNPSKLPIGKSPIIIQYINNLDLNGDEKIDEKILLLGNKAAGITTRYEKLYLLIWDGKKTYLKEMDPDHDGGTFPQIQFENTDKEPKEEIVISAENGVADNFNVFKYTGDEVQLIYTGYEAPEKIKDEQENKGKA